MIHRPPCLTGEEPFYGLCKMPYVAPVRPNTHAPPCLTGEIMVGDVCATSPFADNERMAQLLDKFREVWQTIWDHIRGLLHTAGIDLPEDVPVITAYTNNYRW